MSWLKDARMPSVYKLSLNAMKQFLLIYFDSLLQLEICMAFNNKQKKHTKKQRIRIFA